MNETKIDWRAAFADAHPEPGASEDVLAAAIAGLRLPPSEGEAYEIDRSQSNPFPKGDRLYAAWRPIPRLSTPRVTERRERAFASS